MIMIYTFLGAYGRHPLVAARQRRMMSWLVSAKGNALELPNTEQKEIGL